MATNGTLLGPGTEPNRVETESSGLRCVKFAEAGQYVQFTAAEPANSLVVRYSLPDAERGGGINSTLGLFVNGQRVRTLDLTSRYSWLYGSYPFSNDPSQGKPRNFYDEARAGGLTIQSGDVVRLQWERKDAASCIVDLVDLEEVAPAASQPAGSLSLTDFVVRGDGDDATEALRRCITAVAVRGGVVWVPAGTYRLTGDITLPSNVSVQGAGMWHTTFVGDPALYRQADHRVRFRLKGSGILLADFAIVGRLNYRNDQEPNDGIVGARCERSTIRRIWIEHTKVGIWIYNGHDLTIEGCRFRDTLADGVNLCVGTYDNVVQECSARGTGDDCFALWPAPSDQGFADHGPKSGHNVFRHCTGQLPFLANGGAIYGGKDNRIEDCAFTDITAGCGILLSTTFPTTDPAAGIDNNFSGTTVVTGCELLRCGGFDHAWGPRGSFQICLDRRGITGLRISHVSIEDSLSDGLTIVAPTTPTAHGTLADSELSSCIVRWNHLDRGKHHGLWVRKDATGELTVRDDTFSGVANDSANFRLSER